MVNFLAKRKWFLLLTIIFSAFFFVPHAFSVSKNQACLLTVNGPIGPATADYVTQGFKQAQENQARLLIIQLDTPGGLDTSMRVIVKSILNAAMPVVTYVSPDGARAASAGTYILYASHVAAMAPATNLGAATPVSIGGQVPKATQPANADKSRTPDSAEAMRKKVVNDAVAYIESLAKLRGRNQGWAVKMVKDGSSLSADQALAKRVIDYIAADPAELLEKINGKVVQVQGQQVKLDTKGLIVVEVKPGWRTGLLSVITNPSIAYVLMMLGIYGLFFEFSNPGFILPGVAGTICLVMALYAFHLLPINYAGLALIFLGIAFMISEAFMPSFGALGIGGVIAFIVGSVMLIDISILGAHIAWPLILAVSLINAAFFFFVMTMVIRAQRSEVVSGQEELIGAQAVATEDINGKGLVRCHGELWQCQIEGQLKKEESAEVTSLEGLTLILKK